MQVPEGWKKRKVGELFDVQLGKMLNKIARETHPQFPYLGNSNVQWGRFETSELLSMHFNEKDISKFTLKAGDILMCEGGEVGRCAIWEGSNQKIYYQKALHRLRTKGEILPEFFQNHMERISGTKLLDDYTTKTSIAHLTREKLISMPVIIPSLEEQKKIVQILVTWDKAITTTEQLLANSQQQKKALMQQLLTGKKRLLDDNGQRFSGEWKEYQLGSVAEITMGSSPKSSAYNEGKIGLPLIQGNADIDDRKSAPRVFTSEITQECQIGDILLSVRAPVGSIAESRHHACIGRGVAAIKAKKNFGQSFLYQWLLWFEPRWQTFAQGSTFESINSSDIKTLKLALPKKEEQQKIAAVLAATDQEIATLEQKLAHLKQEKKALMQQLLTGKRRVTA